MFPFRSKHWIWGTLPLSPYYGLDVSVGGRVGAGGGVGLIGSIKPSGTEAHNSISGSIGANWSASVGPASVSGNIVSYDTKEGVQKGGDKEGGLTIAEKKVAGANVKIKAQLKLGGSVGGDVHVKGTSTIVSDTVKLANRVQNAVNATILGSHACTSGQGGTNCH